MSLEDSRREQGTLDGRPGLPLVAGDVAEHAADPAPDPDGVQASCVDAFVASQVARGFSPVTIENATGVLERFLSACGRPAWEVTADDIDRVMGELATVGMAASTRRGYVQAFKGFHAFLVARRAAEIEGWFGVRLIDPVDEFNASQHVSNDSPATRPPPTKQRMDEFFAFLREQGRERSKVRFRGA